MVERGGRGALQCCGGRERHGRLDRSDVLQRLGPLEGPGTRGGAAHRSLANGRVEMIKGIIGKIGNGKLMTKLYLTVFFRNETGNG